jgi:hypothetical protein
MQYHFGSGNLFAVNNAAGTQTPRQFGTLQDVSIDVTFTEKPLYGQYQYPVAVGRGTGKVTGKAKAAFINGAFLADIFFQPTNAPSTTQTIGVTNELHTPTGGPPPTASPNNTTGFADLGVVDAATGIQMVKVASSPVAGVSYTLSGTTYTFANSQGQVFLSYTYTATSTQKGSFTLDNQLLGSSPFFRVALAGLYNGKAAYLNLRQCMASKFTLSTKLEDWTIPEFDFTAFADTSGNIFDWSAAE